MKNLKFQKGIITFQTLLMVASPFVAITGAFYGSRLAINDKINMSEKELTSIINLNTNGITQNTTNIRNIEDKLDDINDNLKILINKL